VVFLGLRWLPRGLGRVSRGLRYTTEGWIYGFRSVIERINIRTRRTKEGASGMSLEAGGRISPTGPPLRPAAARFRASPADVVVGYIEGGVNYWRNGADQLIKKIYINRAEVMANPSVRRVIRTRRSVVQRLELFRYARSHGNGYLDPEDLIIECATVSMMTAMATPRHLRLGFYNHRTTHSQDVTYGHHNGQMLTVKQPSMTAHVGRVSAVYGVRSAPAPKPWTAR